MTADAADDSEHPSDTPAPQAGSRRAIYRKIVEHIVQGVPTSAIAAELGVSATVVTRTLEKAGRAALAIHEELVRNIRVARLECSTTWLYGHPVASRRLTTGADRDLAGDVWLWTARDPDTGMIVSYRAGGQGGDCAAAFANYAASRAEAGLDPILADGRLWLVRKPDEPCDRSTLVAQFGETMTQHGARSPDRTARHEALVGFMRAFLLYPDARPRDMKSRRLGNRLCAVAVYLFHVNFCEPSITKGATPAMQLGITDSRTTIDQLLQKRSIG